MSAEGKRVLAAKSFIERVEAAGRNPRFCCFNCGAREESYMVMNQVWLRAWPDYWEWRRELRSLLATSANTDGKMRLLLCLSCLERKLGRPLVVSDFTDVPINDKIFIGVRIGRRERERAT